MKTRLLGILMLYATFFVPHADASSVEDVVLARSAFDEGDFAKAATLYDGLIGQGIVNGHLYYNAGLTYYRLGEKGRAMALFLAARSLLPRNPDVKANVASVLAEIENKLDATPSRTLVESVAFWLPISTVRELMIVTTVVSGLVGVFLWICLLLPRFASARPYAYWAMILPVLCLASVLVKGEVQQIWGAVTAETTKAYSGPGKSNTLLFELANGAPFRVLDDSGEWLKVELSGGKKGWLSRQDSTVHPQS